MFQITVYELPQPEASQEIAPTLKFIAYDPKKAEQVGNLDIIAGLKNEGAPLRASICFVLDLSCSLSIAHFPVRLRWNKACGGQGRLYAEF